MDGLEEFHRRQNDNLPFNELNVEMFEDDVNGPKHTRKRSIFARILKSILN